MLLAETATQQQVLPVGGLECALRLGDLLAVAALELDKLAGERGNVAGLVRPGAGAAVGGGGASLPGAQLLDAVPDGDSSMVCTSA
jgi:hypothetical protein